MAVLLVRVKDNERLYDIQAPWDGTDTGEKQVLDQIAKVHIAEIVDAKRVSQDIAAQARDKAVAWANQPENLLVSADSVSLLLMSTHVQVYNRFTGEAIRRIVRIFDTMFKGEECYLYGREHGDNVIFVKTPWLFHDMIDTSDAAKFNFWNDISDLSNSPNGVDSVQYKPGADYVWNPSRLITPYTFSSTIDYPARVGWWIFKMENIVFRFWWD